MDETLIVRGGAPEQIRTWLDELAQQARMEQLANRHRSQVEVLTSEALDPQSLPLPLRTRATHAAAIYGRRPSSREPFGFLLVLALIETMPNGILRVEIASDPQFPLKGEEMIWLFRNRFPHTQRGAGGRRTGLLLWINGYRHSDHTGAPVLSCNVWLEEQLSALEDRRQRYRLFRPWLERYRQVRGIEPADPMRSFRAAMQGCERRMKKRKQGG
jgi:hypothetical protein